MTKWKTVLAFTFIFLAILLSPTSAQAPGETASGEMPIPSDILISISSVPDGISDFPLIPGQDNTDGGDIEIIAIGVPGWSLTVSDESSTTGGKMTEYNTTTGGYISPNPDQLQAYMGVTATDSLLYFTNPCVTLDAGGEIAYGPPISAAIIPITFNQTVSWSDPVSETDRGYKIVVTFTIAST